MLRGSIFITTLAAIAICTVPTVARAAANCGAGPTGLVPLSDLGAGLYNGLEGGLYAGGMNGRPSGHEAAGLAIAQEIAPLDTLGNPDAGSGRIVLISIGMSNCTQEFQAFLPKAGADPEKNPRVLAIDCAVGGQSADRIHSPTAAYWDSVYSRLRGHGSSPAQAQVVWIKEANATPHGGFPQSADTLLWNLGTIVRLIHQKLPNVRIAYLTSRIYAGYASTPLNPEPYAYESGFAVKWLVGAQIAGEDSLNYDPSAGTVEAPWLSWGPYLWADGMSPRNDGLVWPCSYFSTADGTHPAAAGRDLVADSLLTFFKADATARPWFLSPTAAADGSGSAHGAGGESLLGAWPNPCVTGGSTRLRFTLDRARPVAVTIFNVSGKEVRRIPHPGGLGLNSVAWDGTLEGGSQARPGVYFYRVEGSEPSRADSARGARVILLRSGP